jgi:hypothetical protein
MSGSRSRVAISALYAAFGAVATELLLAGVAYAHLPGAAARFAFEICVVFIASVIFLEPSIGFLKGKLDRDHPSEPPRARFSSGVFGVVAVLVFIGFSAEAQLVQVALAKGQARPAGTVLYFLGWALSPAIVTLAWITGNRKPRRAALYGALAGFSADAIVRLLLWSATHTIAGKDSETFTTALAAAFGGGLQAGFYAGCGGLALDLARGRHPVRNLALGLFAAIGLWTISFRVVGGAFGLSYTDELASFVIRLLDYAGWMLGVALCPSFAAVIRQHGTETDARTEARFARLEARTAQLIRLVPSLIVFDLLFFVVALNQLSTFDWTTAFAYSLALLSAIAWQCALLSKGVWAQRFNVLVGFGASASVVLLVSPLASWAQGATTQAPPLYWAFVAVLANIMLLPVAAFLKWHGPTRTSKLLGYALAIVSGVAWQLSQIPNPNPAWSTRLNVLAGFCAVASVVLLVPWPGDSP